MNRDESDADAPVDLGAPDACVEYVRVALRAVADSERAPAMARYMKTDMPFYGVSRPQQHRIAREVTRRFPLRSNEGYRATVNALWAEPHREEKYLAIAVARAWPEFIRFANVDLYRAMIVEGAWWDFVDEIATAIIGKVLAAERPQMTALLDRWIDDENLWLRRTALLAQERLRGATDAALLFAYCARRLHEKEFFIRKAIGWALRSYSTTDPDAVAAFVAAHQGEMSGLTLREATRRLPKR